ECLLRVVTDTLYWARASFSRSSLDNNALIHLLPIVIYLASAVDLVLAEVFTRRRFRQSGLLLSALGVVLHGFSRLHALDRPSGLAAHFVNLLSLATCLIMGRLVAAAAIRPRAVEACIIAAPGAALCVALQWLVPMDPLILGQITTAARLHITSSL